MITRRSRKGFTFLSLLMSLAIIAILSQSYMSTTMPDGQTFSQYTQSRAQRAVTAANLRTAETQFFMTTQGRQLPPDQLRQTMDDLSRRMGNGGRFFVVNRQQIMVTTMLDTPLFSESFSQPLIR